MYKKDLILLVILLVAFVWVCRVLSPPWLILFGAVEIGIALWWGRRPRSKDRVVHPHRRKRVYEMP